MGESTIQANDARPKKRRVLKKIVRAYSVALILVLGALFYLSILVQPFGEFFGPVITFHPGYIEALKRASLASILLMSAFFFENRLRDKPLGWPRQLGAFFGIFILSVALSIFHYTATTEPENRSIFGKQGENVEVIETDITF